MTTKKNIFKINDNGWVNLLTALTCMLILIIIIYNVNVAKASNFSVDVKNLLDGVIRYSLVQELDIDNLKDNKFGTSSIWFQHDIETGEFTSNFTNTSANYSAFRTRINNTIKTRFSAIVGTNISDITYHTLRPSFTKIEGTHTFRDFVNGGKVTKTQKIGVASMSVKYVVSFETSGILGASIVTNKFKVRDSDSGEITITRSPSSKSKMVITISGKTSLRYSFMK